MMSPYELKLKYQLINEVFTIMWHQEHYFFEK